MALININADFKALVTVLERIAACLERAYPAPPAAIRIPIGPERLTRIRPDDLYEKQLTGIDQWKSNEPPA